MITDAQLLFSEAQTLAFAVGGVSSTNTVDTAPLATGNEGRNLGALGLAGQVALCIHIPTAVVSSNGASTLNVQLYSGATAGALTNLHWQSGAQTAQTAGTSFWSVPGTAAQPWGPTFIIPLPYFGVATAASTTVYLRWLTLRYTVAAFNTTGGAITASLASGADAAQLFVNSVNY